MLFYPPTSHMQIYLTQSPLSLCTRAVTHESIIGAGADPYSLGIVEFSADHAVLEECRRTFRSTENKVAHWKEDGFGPLQKSNRSTQ